MLDGIYQSLVCFFVTYLAFAPGSFVTKSGQQVSDPPQMGVYVGCVAVFVVNFYILLNTYRWDWLMVLITAVSILLIWFWTGVYSSFRASGQFYKAAEHVYAQLSYWAVFLLAVAICLAPRFTAKAFQKIFMPRDVDIIREQLRQGRYQHLDDDDNDDDDGKDGAAKKASSKKRRSSTSSDIGRSGGASNHNAHQLSEDRTPLYPPSIAATATTQDPRSQHGSDGTDYNAPRDSLERPTFASMDPRRRSYDRVRLSMDKMRPSFEASNDITSAAMLTRMESSQCTTARARRTEDITSDLS